MRGMKRGLATVIAASAIAATTLAVSTTSSAGASVASTSTVVPTTSTLPPLPVPFPPPQDNEPEPQTYHGRIQIPKIDIDRPFIEGIRISTLDYGPGHWPGTAMPGELGNVVVAAHRTSHNADFRRLDELEPGDLVIFDLDDRAGIPTATTPENHPYSGRHVYVVHSVEIVQPDAMWVVDQDYRHSATLFACHPPGSISQRIVAHLDLADAETLELVDPPRPVVVTD